MAIWVWILAAGAISLLSLRGRKMQLEHYIWLLLPVDMYGLTIGGVTFKPYMLFCGFLLLRMLLSGKFELSVKSRWSLISGIIMVLMLGLSAFNSSSLQSFISTAMIAVVWVCCMIYMNDCEEHTPEDITEVLLAAGIGYGTVFVAASLCMKLGLNLPGIVAYTRQEAGMFMSMNNVYEGEFLNILRLRGFTIDPNTMLGPFLFSVSVAVMRLTTAKGGFRELLALVLSFWCIILSNSRMGMICCILIAVVSAIVSYQMADLRCKGRMKLLLLFLVAALVIVSVTGILPRIVESILSAYQNRSGLNDEYGRFTVWKEAAAEWWKRNLFFGVGLSQIQHLTAKARACHNTWLELMCAFGLLLGGLTIGHFLTMLLGGFGYSFRAGADGFAWTMVLGTMGVMISLVGVDNVTASYLWFCGSMVSAISSGCWRRRTI